MAQHQVIPRPMLEANWGCVSQTVMGDAPGMGAEQASGRGGLSNGGGSGTLGPVP